MFEDAIERSGFAWQFIHQYQTFLAGWLTLIAGLFALAAAWAIVKEGKRQRDFRMNQHKIEIQTKRRAVAVMLEADIRSVVETADLKLLAETVKKYAEKFTHADDDEIPTLRFFAPFDKLFLDNYSNYTENMPLMRVETVQEVSRFYLFAADLSKVIEFSNAKMEVNANNQTRANFLTSLSSAAKNTKTQFEQTLPLLAQEIVDAQKELDHLKGEASINTAA